MSLRDWAADGSAATRADAHNATADKAFDMLIP